MINHKSISLILPCKNEGIALQTILQHLPSQIDEVIVVDNGSTDSTIEVAKKFGAKVINEPQKDSNGIGYGFALIAGIKQASGKIIICMDGDNSYPVKETPKIVRYLLQKNLDFISCNRLPVRNPKQMSAVRMLGVKILNWSIFLLFQRHINDSLTGMWVFRQTFKNCLTCREGGWNFSLEIKLNALCHPQVKFTEYHIPYSDRVFNQSKQSIFKTGFNHFLFLIQQRIQLFRGNILYNPCKIEVAKN